MWVLDVVAGEGGGADTTFYLVAGEWSVGRKRCHFNFHADSSISRTHALIRLGDPSTRPTLELVDKNSRFGSFVNQEQSFGTRSLRHGDQISFGAKKTVLRVRYQVFVLVASRIQRASRAQVNDTCQRLGMHLIAAESKDATHCIMDPGRIVATVKVLWALVYNQPVVCTPWIYAILNRSSLSEPLPRCEEFLPSDPLVPSVESNYLPNSLRKTLFQGYAVVFLTPQSMQELIAAMGGVVIAAYKGFEEDDNLLRELDSLASSKRLLLVEPSHASGFSSTAGQSEQRASAALDPPCPVEIVERRVELFKSMGAVFTSVQELAASVIFVKPPSASNDSAFSSSLASYAGSATSTAEHEDDDVKSTREDHGEDADAVDVTIKESSEQHTDPHYEEVKGGTFEDSSINIVQIPTMEEAEKQQSSSTSKSERKMPPRKPNDEASYWKSSRVLQPRDVKFEEDVGRPIVVSCSLVVKKREPSRSGRAGRNGLVNYKRFKKGNGYGSRSTTASLFPQQTVVSVVDNAERKALQENLEAMEVQERIAEELFAMGEGRTKTKLF
ncbi:SMAD/FHA domain [Phytophthora cactorum]|nr:SMAD/FHA domain [Phytophthora cactorum]